LRTKSEQGPLMRALLVCLVLLPLPSAAAGAPPLTQSPTLNPIVPYRLFPPQNVYTFLLFDTQSGFIMKVQWGMDSGHPFMSPLLATCPGVAGKEDPNDHVGRYTLEPTQNIWQFLLLDQDNGSVWHVQWSMDGTNDLCDKIQLGFPSSKK